MNDYIVNAFTREGDNTNFQANNITAGCITSANNKFGIDSEGNITAKSLTVEDMRIATQLVLNVMYPVGSIYMSTSGISPSSLYGGQWEQIKDTFLLACGDKYNVNQIGGEEEHNLTIEELPSHNHKMYGRGYYASGKNVGVWTDGGDMTGGTKDTGGGNAHNNMPPYLAVYMWKRIG